MPPNDGYVADGDPFPEFEQIAFRNFDWQSQLMFLRHRHAPPSAPDSAWQLLADFTVSFDMEDATGQVSSWSLTAPRGMFTDLSSVPEKLWSLVGPIGPHLEASIVHDYLYLAWTDFRIGAPREQDWKFGDAWMIAALEAHPDMSDADIFLIKLALSQFGWDAFSNPDKTREFTELMNEWRGYLPGGGVV